MPPSARFRGVIAALSQAQRHAAERARLSHRIEHYRKLLVDFEADHRAANALLTEIAYLELRLAVLKAPARRLGLH